MSAWIRLGFAVCAVLALPPAPALAGGDTAKWERLFARGDAKALVADAREDGAVAELVGFLAGRMKPSEDGNRGWRTALDAIAELGPEGVEAMDAVAAGLADEDPGLRKRSAQVLGRMGPAAASRVPDLIKLARDEALEARSGAVEALGGIGPDAAAAVPLLVEGLSDRSGEIRFRSAEALGLIGQDPATVVPELTRVLKKDEEAGPRWAAAVALGRFGPAAREAVPVCVKKLEDVKGISNMRGEDNRVRAACAATLGLIGPEAREAVPALLKTLDANPLSGALEDLDTQRAAAEAAGRIGGASEEVVQGLVKALQNPYGLGLYAKVCEVLGAMGPAAAPAAETIAGLAEKRGVDEATRNAAREALKKIRGG